MELASKRSTVMALITLSSTVDDFEETVTGGVARVNVRGDRSFFGLVQGQDGWKIDQLPTRAR
jgi:hypothetical protein